MPPERKHFLIGPISPAAEGALYQQIVDRHQTRDQRRTASNPARRCRPFARSPEDLLVSIITVKRAYEELEREGIIFRRQGLGTFIAEHGHDRNRAAKLNSAQELFRTAAREAAAAGLEPNEILELAQKIIKGKP